MVVGQELLLEGQRLVLTGLIVEVVALVARRGLLLLLVEYLLFLTEGKLRVVDEG